MGRQTPLSRQPGELPMYQAPRKRLMIDNGNRIVIGGSSSTTSSSGADFFLARYITQALSVNVLNVQPQNVSVTGPTTGVEGTSFNLSVSATDPAGPADPLTYSWTITLNGNPYSQASGASISVLPVDNGNYLASVTVNDGDGGIVTVNRSIAVSNVAPTGTFNAPATVNEGSTIVLSITNPIDPSATDTTVGFTYAFDLGSGYGGYSSSNTASFTPGDDGTRTVRGKIRDKNLAKLSTPQP